MSNVVLRHGSQGERDSDKIATIAPQLTQTSDIRQGVDSEEFCLRCQLVSWVRGGWGDVKNVNKYAHLLIVFINNTTAFYHNQS